MKRIILLIVILILMSSCETTRPGNPFIVKFEDKNDSVLNYEMCFKLAKKHCDNIPGCISFKWDGNMVCDNGMCIC